MMGVVGVVFLLFLQNRWEYLLELSGEFPYRRMPEGESDKARKAAKEEKRAAKQAKKEEKRKEICKNILGLDLGRGAHNLAKAIMNYEQN